MITYRLRGMEYADVKLLPSPFKKQRDETMALYARCPANDDILLPFRKKAGIPSDALGMPGWGQSIGQYLGAYAKWWRNTGDEEVHKKAVSLFEGWRECAEKDGRVLDMGTYPYEKMLGGLCDMIEYMGFEEAVPWMRRLTERAKENFDPDIPRDGLQDERMKGQIEWYTLPENLYRAYQLTGEEMYRDFAGQWLYPYVWDRLAAGDFRVGPRHAYSHVNSLSSAARAYIVTGDEHYLEVIKRAYEGITTDHTYCTGGYGPAETLFGEDEGYLGNALISTWDHHFSKGKGIVYKNFAGGYVARSDAWGSCEVSCCTWAVFKLCHYLLRLTGEARFGDWAERLLVNGVLGQPPVTEKGQCLYYASYFADGAIKSYDDRRLQHMGQNFVWVCCTGTFPQDTAEYANMVAYTDSEGLYISQLIPAEIAFEAGGKKLTLVSDGAFPFRGEGRFTLRSDGPVRFRLRVRVPGWADSGNTVRVNGETVSAPAEPDTWLTLDRTWQDGDRVEVDLNYRLRFSQVDGQHKDVCALMWGPVAMCCDEMTVLVGDREHPEEWIRPVEGMENVFETLPGHSGIYSHICRRFYPYWQIGLMKWYYMYNRLYPDMEALDREHQGF